MNGAVLISAFATGIAGSAHCVAMCGGITAALGLGSLRQRYLWLYHGGRLLSYAMLGMVFGCLLPLLGAQPQHPVWGVVLRVTAAVVMCAVGLQIALGVNGLHRLETWGGKLWRHMAGFVQSLLPVHCASDALLLGCLWGLLPCGLIYSALGLAVVSGNPLMAALVMLAFGAGTLPAMLLLGVFSGTLLRALTHGSSRFLLGGLVVLAALWTVLPFLS